MFLINNTTDDFLKLPVSSSHVAVGGHLHCLQSGKPKNPGLHLVHCLPITFGLHLHCPPNFSQSYLKQYFTYIL